MPPKTVFVREATGLVKQASMTDGFILSAASGLNGIGLLGYFAYAFGTFPGTDLVSGLIIHSLIYTGTIVAVYLLFSVVMPRSGGEYVFVSRSLSPGIGFTANWSNVIWQIAAFAIGPVFFATAVLSPILSGLGFLTGSTAMIAWGTQFLDPTTVLISASIISALLWVLLLVGLKKVLRTLNVVWIIGVLGMVVWMYLLAVNSNASFVAAFNAFAGPYLKNSTNPYQYVISTAASNSFVAPTSTTLFAGLPYAVAVGLTVNAWVQWSVYINGEIKGASSLKRQLVMIGAPPMVLAILVGILVVLSERTLGLQFLASITFLATTAPQTLPAPFSTAIPSIPLFVMMISGSPILVVFLGICFICLSIAGPMMFLPMLSRSVFAWAFDRVIPSKFADVDSRFHSPTYTILLLGILSEVVIVLTVYYSSILALLAGATAAPLLQTFMPVAVAGIVFPYTRKEMFDMSPIRKYKIAGVPVISVAGVAMMLYCAWLAYVWFTSATLYLSSPASNALVIIMWVGGLAVFYFSRWYRKHEGMDLDLMFKTIPPE